MSNPFRFAMISMTEWKRFDQFSIFLIVLNSVFLGLIDYTNKDAPTIGNLINFYSEPIFAVLFSIEAFIKIIAYGLVFDRKCYLRDPWNWLDFVVAVTAILNFFPNM